MDADTTYQRLSQRRDELGEEVERLRENRDYWIKLAAELSNAKWKRWKPLLAAARAYVLDQGNRIDNMEALIVAVAGLEDIATCKEKERTS